MPVGVWIKKENNRMGIIFIMSKMGRSNSKEELKARGVKMGGRKSRLAILFKKRALERRGGISTEEKLF